MNGLLASCLVLLGSAASAATILDNAAATAAQFGGTASDVPTVAEPAARPTPDVLAAVGVSQPVSSNVLARGDGPISCTGGRWNGWVNLHADVSVVVADGASARFPATGTVFLTGSCQRGAGGFASGSATMRGSGELDKDGRRAGTVTLSGTVYIDQYVNGSYAWLSQNVSLSGTYDEPASAN